MKGKVAIVTGGAGGIGSAVSRAFANEGVGVAIARIDYDQQDQIREGLPCASHRHRLFWPDS